MHPFDSFAYFMNIHPSIRLWGPIVSPHPAWRRPILVLAPPSKTRGKQSVQTCPSRAQEWSVSVPLLQSCGQPPETAASTARRSVHVSDVAPGR